MYRLLLISVLVWGKLFAQGSPTYHVGSGPTLPSTCSAASGDVFYKTVGTGTSTIGTLWNCDALNHWTQIAGSGSNNNTVTGGSGSFYVVRTSATVLTIGPDCSVSFPCNFYLGNIEYSLTTSATATISAGTDTAYIYLSSTGALTVGTNTQVVTCANCTAVTGVTSFPRNSLPLWTWASVSGAWASTGTNRIRIVGRPSSIEVYGVSFTNSGADLTSGAIGYSRNVVSNCTISAYTIITNVASSITFDVWKIASGTALPTIANTIIPGSAYLGTGSNPRSHGEPVTAFTSNTLTHNDTLAFKIQTQPTSGLTSAHIEVECQ